MIIWSVGFGQEIKHLRIKQPKHTSLRLKKKDMKFVTVLLGLCCLDQALGGTHSMKYITTQVFGISGMPQYTTVGMVDESPFVYFDSHIKKMTPKTTWITENVGTDYWDRESQREAGIVPVFANNVQIAMQRFNQSTGVHVVQRYYGCEWDDATGATKGFSLDGYDGEDWISLDLENLRYIAAVSQAFPTKQKWEAERGHFERRKNYFSSQCIESLRKYVGYGSSTLERKVPPKVSMFQRDSISSAVVCHATGFYPQGVMITWKRDGKEMTDDTDVGETLPNADGNFQKRAVLNVQLEDRKSSKYTCEVTHSSGEPITMILNEDELKRSNPDSVPLGPIIGVVVGLLVVIAVIAGFVVLRNKKKSGFARANTDESSQSSGEKA